MAQFVPGISSNSNNYSEKSPRMTPKLAKALHAHLERERIKSIQEFMESDEGIRKIKSNKIRNDIVKGLTNEQIAAFNKYKSVTRKPHKGDPRSRSRSPTFFEKCFGRGCKTSPRTSPKKGGKRKTRRHRR
jgi:hypothetical protein